MAKKFLKIPIKKLVNSLCDRLQNRFSVEIVIEGKRGCLAGDTVIRYSRGKNARKISIKKLFNNYQKSKVERRKTKYNLSTPTYIRAYNGKEIRLHKLKDIFYSGKQQVFQLILEDGKTIKATSDHKFLTEIDGWKELKDLKIGDKILCDTPKAVKNGRKKIKLRDIRLKVDYHPYNKTALHNDVEVHRLIYEARLNNLKFLDFLDILINDKEKSSTLKFINPKIYVIHHIDGCHYNNSIENLQCLTKEEHSKIDGENIYKNFSQGIPKAIKIKEIIKLGIEDVYDIECEEPYHNFSANDIIVHNCGKSTLAWNLSKRIRREMKRRGVDGYIFKPSRDVLYTQKEVMKFFNDWKRIGIADELIGIVFNRDFYSANQKDIIKMMNMNRDHCNCFISCVPSFKTIDTQVKNIISMRLTVVRRGLAILHTPNKTIYSKDIWDEAYNEKIERKWLEKGLTNPKYAQLTTVRGYVTFPKMSEKDEMKYQDIKNKKRNLIADEKGLNEEEAETDPFKIIYNALVNGKIKNMSALEGMMVAHNFQWSSLKGKLFRELKKNSKPTSFSYYFYDKKGEKKDEANELYRA